MNVVVEDRIYDRSCVKESATTNDLLVVHRFAGDKSAYIGEYGVRAGCLAVKNRVGRKNSIISDGRTYAILEETVTHLKAIP